MGALDRVFRGRRGGQERPAAAIVAGLWRNGEQGVWYDPSDLSTMYQDAAGTTPVYMPGQGQVDPPVGLLLDKRKGLARGPERLVNGDFSAGAANWSVSGNDATHIATFSGGTLRFQSDTTSPVMLVQQLGAMVTGRWYEITVTVSAWVSGSIKSDNFVQSGLTLASGAGVYKVIGLAAGTTFAFLRASANVDLTIDSISLREVLGNHAYQTTTTCRPTLSARYNLLLSSENLAAAPWSINGTSTRTAEFSTAPNGTLTATRIQLGTLASDEVRQVFSTTAGAGVGYTAAIWLKSNTGTDQQVRLKNTHINVIDNFQTVTVTPDWKRFALSVTNGSSAGTGQLFGITNAAGGGAKDVLAWGADLRVINDGVGLPEYQRVVDANNYDTVGFPLHLRFDGVDDFLQTASVNFSGTDKLFASAALRKLSDAATGMLLELSPTLGSNSGTFYITAPGAANTGNVKLATKGTTEVNVATGSSAFPSPASVVASAIMDIAAQLSTLRVNGAVAQTSSSSLGTGALGNYPIYIGRRAGTSLPFNGRLYSLLVRGAITPDAQIAKVERYLNAKSRAF